MDSPSDEEIMKPVAEYMEWAPPRWFRLLLLGCVVVVVKLYFYEEVVFFWWKVLRTLGTEIAVTLQLVAALFLLWLLGRK